MKHVPKIILLVGLIVTVVGVFWAVSGYNKATGAFDAPVDERAFWHGSAAETPEDVGVDVSGSLNYTVARKTDDPAPTKISILEIDRNTGAEQEKFQACSDCDTYDHGFEEAGQFLVDDNENDIRVTVEGGGEVYLLYPASELGGVFGGGVAVLKGIGASCFGLVLLLVGLITFLTKKGSNGPPVEGSPEQP